jgi:hypothetical protein
MIFFLQKLPVAVINSNTEGFSLQASLFTLSEKSLSLNSFFGASSPRGRLICWVAPYINLIVHRTIFLHSIMLHCQENSSPKTEE